MTCIGCPWVTITAGGPWCLRGAERVPCITIRECELADVPRVRHCLDIELYVRRAKEAVE